MFVSLLSQFLLLLSPFPSKTGCRKACEPEPSAAWAVGTNRWLSPGSRTGSPSRPRWAWTSLPLTPILASSAFLALTPATRGTSLAWRATPLPRSGTPPSCRSKVTTQPVSLQDPIPTHTTSVALAHASTGTPRSRYCCTLFCSFTRSFGILHFACLVCIGRGIHFHHRARTPRNVSCTARGLLIQHRHFFKYNRTIKSKCERSGTNIKPSNSANKMKSLKEHKNVTEHAWHL